MVLVRDIDDSDSMKNAFEIRYKKTEEKVKHYIFCAATHQDKTLWLDSLGRIADSNLRHHRSISGVDVGSDLPPMPVKLSEDQRTESVSRKRRPLPNVPKPPIPQNTVPNTSSTESHASSGSFSQQSSPSIPIKKPLSIDNVDKHPPTNNNSGTTAIVPGKLPKPPTTQDEKISPALPKKSKATPLNNFGGSAPNMVEDVLHTPSKRNSLDSEKKLPTPIKLQVEKKII